MPCLGSAEVVQPHLGFHHRLERRAPGRGKNGSTMPGEGLTLSYHAGAGVRRGVRLVGSLVLAQDDGRWGPWLWGPVVERSVR